MDRCYKDISRGVQWRVTGEISRWPREVGGALGGGGIY